MIPIWREIDHVHLLAFWVWQSGAGSEAPRHSLCVAASNLTGRSYRNLEYRDYSTFGEPRKFTANLKYKF